MGFGERCPGQPPATFNGYGLEALVVAVEMGNNGIVGDLDGVF